ncbi:adenosylcobinamide-GDP ribazoletransferase, partial [Vibrio alfacsensis]|uniref:adenosylcobinamide-GDP ribazoletransferase n=1 Tax=Vibrio alfacsensis TaxID=1074311 RepID=UPI004069161F
MQITITLVIWALLFRIGFKRWLMARLGGFPGDCLGAAQQIVELSVYLILLAYTVP